ncbi:MAG TPA: SCO family protein [Myxococcota bacterium]|nr:SCO family protein [Myxococcota bacterium]
MRARIAALGVLSLLTATIGAADDAGFRAGTFSPPRVAPDFSLRGSDGAELNLGRFRGKVVILGFGFTSCPNVCPITLAVLAEARKKLAAQAAELQVVYITVDPARDDAERMRKYLGSFDPTFIGGTGSADELAAVRQSYGITATREDIGTSYGFSHSSYTYLIDREGNLRALMPYGHSADDYVHDVEILLKP